MMGREHKSDYTPPSPIHRQGWWIATVLFSGVSSVAVESFLNTNPDAEKIIANVTGQFVSDLLPYIIFLILQIDWILILKRVGHQINLKIQVLLKFFSIALFLIAGGILAGFVSFLIGATYTTRTRLPVRLN